MSDTFLRYLLLLRELPCAPEHVDATRLLRRLDSLGIGVTRRTVQRDLERLSALLPVVCNDTTKPYGWAWLGSRERGWPQTLHTITRHLGPSGSPAVELRLRCQDRADLIARLGTSAQIRRDGSGQLVVSLRARPGAELLSWLLSFGPALEVVAPTSLRREMQSTLAALIALYDE